jgi:hypothetical protein
MTKRKTVADAARVQCVSRRHGASAVMGFVHELVQRWEIEAARRKRVPYTRGHAQCLRDLAAFNVGLSAQCRRLSA